MTQHVKTKEISHYIPHNNKNFL